MTKLSWHLNRALDGVPMRAERQESEVLAQVTAYDWLGLSGRLWIHPTQMQFPLLLAEIRRITAHTPPTPIRFYSSFPFRRRVNYRARQKYRLLVGRKGRTPSESEGKQS